MPAVGRRAGIVLALRQEAASATVLVPSISCRHASISGWFRLIRVQAKEQSRNGRLRAEEGPWLPNAEAHVG